MVVDDSSTVRTILGGLLSTNPGFELVGMASDGDEGVAVALRERPDIVVMDVQMPRLDGLAASREILAEWPEARIVIHTGSVDDALRSEAMEIGIWGYAIKGKRPARFVEQLRVTARSESGLATARTEAPTMIDSTVLDELAEMMGERGSAVIAEVLRTWFEESPALLAVIAPDSTADVDAILRAAHSLKSSSRTVGALTLGDAAELVEHAARADDLASATAPRARIPGLFAEAKSELQRRHAVDQLA